MQRKDDYRKAYIASYNYVRETINIESRIDTLKSACLELGAYANDFETKLHVSEEEIPNDINLVLCDYIKKKYNITESCARLFGANSTIVQHVNDSINAFKSRRSGLQSISLRDVASALLSKKDKGYVVFFSKLNNDRTLSAELMSFCNSYKESKNWYGASRIFYFTFNEDWEIEDVFFGKKYYQ